MAISRTLTEGGADVTTLTLYAAISWKNNLPNQIMLSKYMILRVFQTSGDISYGWQWIIGHTIIVLMRRSDA